MIAKQYVREALQHAWEWNENPEKWSGNQAKGQSSLITQLIYDIFGGEILKTGKNKRWHFYNRIDGEIIDFSRSEMAMYSGEDKFEDIPSSPDEIHHYFAPEDYSTFFVNFTRAFEYAVHLEKWRGEKQED